MPPSIALPTPSWAPPSTRTTTPVGVEGAEPLAGDRAAVELELGEHRPRSPRARRRRSAPREIAPESSVPSTRSLASVGRGNSGADRVAGADLVGERGDLGRGRFGSIRIGRARTRPASARASTSSSSATGRSAGSRSRYSSSGVISSREVDSAPRADLLEQVVAADQVLGALVAERGDHSLTSSPIALKKRAQFSAAVRRPGG